MFYDVSYGYTLDSVTWTCPKCGCYVEKGGDYLYDLDCPECGFEREDSRAISDDSTTETETCEYNPDENEDEDEEE